MMRRMTRRRISYEMIMLARVSLISLDESACKSIVVQCDSGTLSKDEARVII